MATDYRDRIDEILDEALSSYASVEPRAGLENRVLETVRAAKTDAKRLWRRFALAASALVCIALLYWTGSASRPRPQTTIAATPPDLPIQSYPRSLVLTHTVQRLTLKQTPLPQLAQFPTPSPLTPEERALMGFVAHQPKLAAEAFEDLKAQSKPIEIEAISIPPLQPAAEP